MLKLGYVQLKADPAGFYWYNEGVLSGVLLMHVDGFIWGGTHAFENKAIVKIKSEFQVGQQYSGAFKYIGMQVTQDDDGMILDQHQCLKSVKSIPINVTKACNSFEDCNKTEEEHLRSLLGQIGWMSTNTRPDVSYDALDLGCVLGLPFLYFIAIFTLTALLNLLAACLSPSSSLAAPDILLTFTPTLSNFLMQELISVSILSFLQMVNFRTLFLLLYFHLPTT